MDLKNLIRQNFPDFLEEGLIDDIIENATLHEANEGDIIMEIDDYIRSVPLVLSGSIKILREDKDANEILLYYLENGDTCASSLTCCMMMEKSKIKAVAEQETTFLKIPVKKIDEWISSFKSWKNFILKSYSKRVEELLNTVDEIAFKKMDDRLWNYLQKKSEILNQKKFKITHQEIAYDLNSSREVISRLLKKLENSGKIKLGRNKIEVL